MLEARVCEACSGTGIWIIYLLFDKKMILDCQLCKGTGYRVWIDEIKRPYKKSSIDGN